MFQDFVSAYRSPLSAASAAAVAERVAGLGDALAAAFGRASADPDRVIRDAGTLAADAATLAGVLKSAYRAPFDDDDLPDAALVAGFNALSSFSRNLVIEADALAPTTIDLVSRAQSFRVIGQITEAAAFAGLAEAVAGRAYRTADDVERDETTLSDAYSAIQAGYLSAPLAALLADVHVAASEVLRDSAVRLPRVTVIRIVNVPASVLSYMLYDSDKNEQAIVDLNLDQTPVLLAGDISVLIND